MHLSTSGYASDAYFKSVFSECTIGNIRHIGVPIGVRSQKILTLLIKP